MWTLLVILLTCSVHIVHVSIAIVKAKPKKLF